MLVLWLRRLQTPENPFHGRSVQSGFVSLILPSRIAHGDYQCVSIRPKSLWRRRNQCLSIRDCISQFRNTGPGALRARHYSLVGHLLGSISGYAGARTTVGLAFLGMAPKQFKTADKAGRPWCGLVPTLLVGGGLGYLKISNSGLEVFTWFTNSTSLFTLFGWRMIYLAHIGFRWAWASPRPRQG